MSSSTAADREVVSKRAKRSRQPSGVAAAAENDLGSKTSRTKTASPTADLVVPEARVKMTKSVATMSKFEEASLKLMEEKLQLKREKLEWEKFVFQERKEEHELRILKLKADVEKLHLETALLRRNNPSLRWIPTVPSFEPGSRGNQ